MLIDKNIEVLSENQLHWFGAAENEGIKPNFIAAESEKIEYFEDEKGNILLLEDVYDHSYENNPQKKEIIFVLGINSLNEIRELYRKKNKDSILIIIEPNLSFFSHVILQKDMSVFKKENIFIFADTEIGNLNDFLQPLFHRFSIVSLAKNITFYMTDYYRKFDHELTKQCIIAIRQITRSIIFAFGNDIRDSLTGLKQNLENLQWIQKSKNPIELKDKFEGYPAIIVSAGPSLNKNLQYLKDAEGKAIIIAVDTIIEKLLEVGIIPDFVCSIERIAKVYDYFYKNKKIPEKITLVAPPLLDSRVFNEFEGNMVLPFRSEVKEYEWLQAILGIEGDIGMLMGLSCAHVAFGWAQLLGCSPIVLIGQDLAYGSKEGETHASGTTYDHLEKKDVNTKDDDFVDGYFGEKVKTTKTWTLFKVWFEKQIGARNLHVINATEGGAKIDHAQQMSLKNVIDQYCINNLPLVKNLVDSCSTYNIDFENAKVKFEKEIDAFNSFNEQCILMLHTLNNLEITAGTFSKSRDRIIQKLTVTDALMDRLMKHPLLVHNLQAVVLKYMWDKNSLEPILNVENLIIKRNQQIRFLAPVTITLSEITSYLEITSSKF